jgi:hypothetical protein
MPNVLIFLQLTVKDKMIESLQDSVNEINLITVQMQEGKEKLIQNLQSHIIRLQRQLKFEVTEKFVTLI